MPSPRKPWNLCRHCQRECARARQVYCGAKCQMDYQYVRYIARWKAGLEDGTTAHCEVSNHIRRYLIEKYGEKCSRCGWGGRNPVSGLVPITLDHRDGRWYNSSEDNLQLLCPNCHSLTPTYGGMNRGNGRPKRHTRE